MMRGDGSMSDLMPSSAFVSLCSSVTTCRFLRRSLTSPSLMMYILSIVLFQSTTTSPMLYVFSSMCSEMTCKMFWWPFDR